MPSGVQNGKTHRVKPGAACWDGNRAHGFRLAIMPQAQANVGCFLITSIAQFHQQVCGLIEYLHGICKPCTVYRHVALLHGTHGHQIHLQQRIAKIGDVSNIGLEITHHKGNFVFLIAGIKALLLAGKHLGQITRGRAGPDLFNTGKRIFLAHQTLVAAFKVIVQYLKAILHAVGHYDVAGALFGQFKQRGVFGARIHTE